MDDLRGSVRQLRAMRGASLSEAITELMDARTGVRCAQIVKELAPERFKDLYGKDLWHQGPDQLTALEQATMETLEERFPVGWGMWDMWLNLEYGENPYIEIEPGGFWFYDSDFEEDLDNGFTSVTDSAGPVVFAKMLDYFVAKEEYWQKAAERFGWPEVYPTFYRKHKLFRSFDAEQFEQLLRQNGLEDMFLAFEMATWSTGNYFLDLSGEGSYDYPELKLEAVQTLTEEWKAARELLERLENLERKIKERPELLKLIVSLWESCLNCDLRKPKTLMQLLGESEPSPIIDPFYGPIGVDNDH